MHYNPACRAGKSFACFSSLGRLKTVIALPLQAGMRGRKGFEPLCYSTRASLIPNPSPEGRRERDSPRPFVGEDNLPPLGGIEGGPLGFRTAQPLPSACLFSVSQYSPKNKAAAATPVAPPPSQIASGPKASFKKPPASGPTPAATIHVKLYRLMYLPRISGGAKLAT